MKLASGLYRNSVLFFMVFMVAVLWAFWGTYYSNPLKVSDALVQIHGVGMSLWCVMLLVQAYLIRTKQMPLHRQIGRASFVLAPLNFVLQIVVVRIAFPAFQELSMRPRLPTMVTFS